MTPESIRLSLALPSFMLALASFICNIIVARKSHDAAQSRANEKTDIAVFKMIFWLAVSGISYNIVWMAQEAPSVLSMHHYNAGVCVLIGFATQFTATVDLMWHFLMAGSLLCLICFSNLEFMHNMSSKYLCYICISALVISVIPMIFDKYNGFYNYKDYSHKYTPKYNYECWTNGNFEYIWIVMAIIAWLLHLLVFAASFYDYCCTYKSDAIMEREDQARTQQCELEMQKFFSTSGGPGGDDNNHNTQDMDEPITNEDLDAAISRKVCKYLFHRLWPWLLLFTITRSATWFARIYEFVIHEYWNRSYTMVLMHNLADGSFGIGNLIIWCCNMRVQAQIDHEKSAMTNRQSSSARTHQTNINANVCTLTPQTGLMESQTDGSGNYGTTKTGENVRINSEYLPMPSIFAQ